MRITYRSIDKATVRGWRENRGGMRRSSSVSEGWLVNDPDTIVCTEEDVTDVSQGDSAKTRSQGSPFDCHPVQPNRLRQYIRNFTERETRRPEGDKHWVTMVKVCGLRSEEQNPPTAVLRSFESVRLRFTTVWYSECLHDETFNRNFGASAPCNNKNYESPVWNQCPY